MADNIRQTRISLRTDTLENWTSNKDVILLDGEQAVVVDGDRQWIKIGDGVRTFENLPYVNQIEVRTDLLTARDITAKSIAQGYRTAAVPTGLATGIYTEVSGSFGVAHGIEAEVLSSDSYAFVYNGVNFDGINARYGSHGEGSFSVNPLSGLSGFWVGESTLADEFGRKQPSGDYLSASELSFEDIILNEQN